MSIFKDMLKSGESLFKDDIPLSFDYIPKLIPYREKEQRYIAECIKPLLFGRNGKNLLLYGPPGVGKTVAIKHLFSELEEETDEASTVYVNCWQKNTTFKIMCEVCDQLGYKFTHNKKADEMTKIIEGIVKDKAIVFCFDEIDKVEDLDFLYTLLESLYRKTIILITNYREWIITLDERIKSRLMVDSLEFKPYDSKETKGILTERAKFAFVSDAFDEEAFDYAIKKATEVKDIRAGLYILKEAGLAAEAKSSKKIMPEHVKVALEKLSEFTIKKVDELDEEAKFCLNVIKANSGQKIGELFKLYEQAGGKCTYKTFQRKISFLSENRFIMVEKIKGGLEGNTSIVSYNDMKKIIES